MTEFTPISSTLGGVLIGLSAVMMLAVHGRIAGISGIVGGLLGRPATERRWRAVFVLGLLAGGALAFAVMPQQFGAGSPTSLPWLAIAGVAVGIGTRLGSGCTSGHGVCGLSRLSPRSFVATGVFMTVAATTVYFTHHVGG